MKKGMIVLTGIFAIVLLFSGMGLQVRAQTGIQGSLMITQEDTQVRAEASENAEVVVSLPAGTNLMVTGESDEWYSVFYQGKTLYVKKDAVKDSAPVSDGVLDSELQKKAEDSALYIEKLEAAENKIPEEEEKEAPDFSDIMWIIVGIMATAIFAAATLTKKRKNCDTKPENKE